MKKSIKNCISSILTLLSVLSLVSCDGGGSEGGGPNGTSVANNGLRGDIAEAPTDLLAGERIEYSRLGSTSVAYQLNFVSTSLTSNVNSDNKVFGYNSDLGSIYNFQIKATGEEVNLSQREKLQTVVTNLIIGPDSNADFISLIRGDVPYNANDMAAILVTQGFTVKVEEGELIAQDGPVFYDHTIDSNRDAQLVAGVIEGIYNRYKTTRKVTFRDATNDERDALETAGTNFSYSIPEVVDISDNLDKLVASGDATLVVEGARFKIFLQADNTGR